MRLILLMLVLSATGACSARSQALDRIQARGMLRIATDPSFPPFEYVNEEGMIVGFDVELARAIAEQLGVDAHFVTTGYDALYDALTVGRADVIISALYPDPTRSADFSFSTPYFNAGQVLVTLKEDSIEGLSDLAGKTVVCVFGTAGHMEILRLQDELTPTLTIIAVETLEGWVEPLENSLADAALVDRVSAHMAVSQASMFTISTPPLTDELYVVAARQEDAELVEAIDEILLNLEKEGVLADMVDRWMQP